MTLPAICSELKVRSEDGIAVVSSRDVAVVFEKNHQHVLRDIRSLLETCPTLDRSWFCENTEVDTYGREQPSFDLTRQGFTLLVMGWTGERAMAFKVRYIQAFDAMDAALRSNSVVTTDHIRLLLEEHRRGMGEIVAPLVVRFAGQDEAIGRVENRMDALVEDVSFIKKFISGGRRNLSENTKREHVDAITQLGGRCPCCSRSTVVDEGQKSKFAQFDHFYQNSNPNPDQTWLICTPCHGLLTRGHLARTEADAMFRSYQTMRKSLPGRQRSLF